MNGHCGDLAAGVLLLIAGKDRCSEPAGFARNENHGRLVNRVKSNGDEVGGQRKGGGRERACEVAEMGRVCGARGTGRRLFVTLCQAWIPALGPAPSKVGSGPVSDGQRQVRPATAARRPPLSYRRGAGGVIESNGACWQALR